MSTDGSVVASTVDGHFSVAMMAVKKGLLGRDAAIEALDRVRDAAPVPGITTFWVGEGLLTTDELHDVCVQLAATGEVEGG
ncbi:MAG TPA: hypothetical protein ENK57_01320, partial [Polyangiaceae bacterium]|nr:hypothetical protein [Polyangiaceae bacterium]